MPPHFQTWAWSLAHIETEIRNSGLSRMVSMEKRKRKIDVVAQGLLGPGSGYSDPAVTAKDRRAGKTGVPVLATPRSPPGGRRTAVRTPRDWGRRQAALREKEKTPGKKRRAGAARGRSCGPPPGPPSAAAARGAWALASALLGRARRRAYWKRAGSCSRSMKSGSTRLRYCCQH